MLGRSSADKKPQHDDDGATPQQAGVQQGAGAPVGAPQIVPNGQGGATASQQAYDGVTQQPDQQGSSRE